MSERRGLGRGLSALIPPGASVAGGLRDLPISAIAPNPRQPRGGFDEDELRELADSITDVGLLQPVVVREVGADRYELVAGERRLRAARLAGLTRVPAILRDTKDQDLLREALIENIHRVALNPLEEAAAYQQLLEDFGVTQEELAQRVGKSRPAITNALRLLSLPPSIQRRIAAGVLSSGHAKALLGLSAREDQERLAERIVAEGLSVRSTEEFVRFATDGGGQAGSATAAPAGTRRSPSPGLSDLSDRLSDALATRVQVAMGARRGRMTIEFGSLEDLERIVGVIASGLHTPIEVPER